MSILRTSFLAIFIICLNFHTAFSQDDPVRVNTEEIKVNISAFNAAGKFDNSLKKEDIVINEDNILHQPSSLRHVPASVLIVLDTGGEDRMAKDFKTTRDAAKSLIKLLQPEDSVSVIHYHDKVEVIAEWTQDKQLLSDALTKKLAFGKRSVFTEALGFAVRFFKDTPLDNRHMVLITDGLDSQSTRAQRAEAIRNILATNINVHVLSYTKMELDMVEHRKKTVTRSTKPAINLPPGAGIPIPGPAGQTQPTVGVAINMDREMMRKIKERGEQLKQAEADLTALSEDANGEIYLPIIREEMIDKTETLARNIDSQYVVTYVPKRPLGDVRQDEERNIEVTSRRDDVQIQGRRKLVVKAKN